MTVSSRKNKGRRLQQYTRDKILESFSELNIDDVRSTSMGCSGVDVQLSQAAKKIFPYSVETKNQEKCNMWDWIVQCESNCQDNTIPLLVFKRNNQEPYAAVPFEHFMELVKIVKKIGLQL